MDLLKFSLQTWIIFSNSINKLILVMMSVFSLRDELILKYNFDELRHEVLFHLWAGQRFLINQTRDLHSFKTHWTAPTSREWNGPHFRMFRMCKQGSNRSGTASVVGFVISCVDLESYYWADEHRKMFSDAWARQLITYISFLVKLWYIACV